jgi:purine-binding chemotaxis protein CheW
MEGDVALLVFGSIGQQYALRLETVERVVRAVELTPLPGAPPAIRGIFSLHGRIIPVGDFPRRIGNVAPPISISDHIVIARSPRRVLGVLAQGTVEVLTCAADEVVRAADVLDGVGAITGIMQLPSGLVLIQDLAAFLSLDEEPVLDEALRDV